MNGDTANVDKARDALFGFFGEGEHVDVRVWFGELYARYSK